MTIQQNQLRFIDSIQRINNITIGQESVRGWGVGKMEKGQL